MIMNILDEYNKQELEMLSEEETSYFLPLLDSGCDQCVYNIGQGCIGCCGDYGSCVAAQYNCCCCCWA